MKVLAIFLAKDEAYSGFNFFFSKEIQERIQKILVNIMPLFFVDKFCDCLRGLPGGGSSRRHGANDWRQSSQKAPSSAEKRKELWQQ